MIEEKKRKIQEEEDYIDNPKCKNSIKKFIEKNPRGASEELIAKFLLMEEQEVEQVYKKTIEKIRAKLKL